MRVPSDTMPAEFERVLTKYGFTPGRARDAAEIFAQNSLAGVYSHGLNRFPVVVDYLRRGETGPETEAVCTARFGATERRDGRRGFGPLNAKRAMDRAVELAGQHGIGLVAPGNNNHRMRGGSLFRTTCMPAFCGKRPHRRGCRPAAWRLLSSAASSTYLIQCT